MSDIDARYLKIPQGDVERVQGLYEGVMSFASHGLFFREGIIFGRGIASQATDNENDFFGVASDILKSRGWVRDITFKKNEVLVNGSIEAADNDCPTCHKMRGIISSLYESKLGKQLTCLEVQCESMGAKQCVFKIDTSGVEMLKYSGVATKIINNNAENKEG